MLGVCLILFTVSILFVYTDLLISIHTLWLTHSSYNHGYLILALSLYILFTSTSETNYSGYKWIAVIAMAICSLLQALATAANLQTLQILILFTSLPVLLCACFGLKYAKVCFIPYLLLLTVVPVWDVLTPLLQIMAAKVNEAMLHMMDYPAYIEEFVIQLPQGHIVINEGCAGGKFFLNSVVLSILFAHYLPCKTYRTQAMFTCLVLVTSIVANWIRILILILVGYYTDLKHPLMSDHVFFGWMVYAISITPIFLLAQKIQKTSHPSEEETKQDKNEHLNTSNLYTSPLIALLLIFTPLMLEAFQPQSQLNYTTKTLPDHLGLWQLTAPPPYNLTPDYKGADHIQQGSYQAKGSEISVFALTYIEQSQGKELIHYDNHIINPDIWKIKSSEDITLNNGKKKFPLRHFIAADKWGNKLIIDTFYVINKQIMISKIEAKLAQSLSIFTGNTKNSVLVFTQQCRNDCQASTKQQSDFIRAYAQNILTDLELYK